MYGLSLPVTQRGLSLTEDMAVSSPTVAEHEKVGVKEGDMQRERGTERERGGERVMTARGAVSLFSALPPKP